MDAQAKEVKVSGTVRRVWQDSNKFAVAIEGEGFPKDAVWRGFGTCWWKEGEHAEFTGRIKDAGNGSTYYDVVKVRLQGMDAEVPAVAAPYDPQEVTARRICRQVLLKSGPAWMQLLAEQGLLPRKLSIRKIRWILEDFEDWAMLEGALR